MKKNPRSTIADADSREAPPAGLLPDLSSCSWSARRCCRPFLYSSMLFKASWFEHATLVCICHVECVLFRTSSVNARAGQKQVCDSQRVIWQQKPVPGRSGAALGSCATLPTRWARGMHIASGGGPNSDSKSDNQGDSLDKATKASLREVLTYKLVRSG